MTDRPNIKEQNNSFETVVGLDKVAPVVIPVPIPVLSPELISDHTCKFGFETVINSVIYRDW